MHPAYRWTDSYPYHTNPRAKEIDHGMNSPYYPWPYPSNYSYPIPQSCHSCCNHTYFGGPGSYTFTTPYPHYRPPPPQPIHTHGFYPPFPGTHPAYPVPPPPHYSIYDYEKNTPNHHQCYGCDKKPSIQPQEPEVEKKTSESLVPFMKDYPYPIMWVPPSYMNTESNAKEKENQPHDPVLRPLESSRKGGNGEVPKDSFPFPMFWLPSKNSEVKKDMNEENLDESEKSSVQKVIPVKQLGTKEGIPSKNNEVKNGEVRQESFPFPIFWLPSKNNEVKESTKEENLDEKIRKNDEVESGKSSKHPKAIPVKQLGTKEENNSTQKTSKLPPVCLRIDPLPKKKNGSRSPSPPGDKKRLNGSITEDSKSFKQQKTESSQGLKNDIKKVEKDSVEKGVVEEDRSTEVEGSKVEKRKKLSENEAVLKIQSVYRGFEVRKSQPLMKLREIARVGKQVVELRKRIQELESSGIDDKQKLVIGETIMSLLLKLDTIQGLHPVVRDVRKSVAKELVGLQEKLDSLTIVKQSQTRSEQTTISADEEDQTLPQLQATESQVDDGGEARNADLEPELQNEENIGELNNNDQMELDQPAVDHENAQSDTNDEAVRLDLDDHEVEASDPPTHDMKPEHLVEHNSGKLDNNQDQMAVEIDKLVDDVVQEKSDQIPTLMELEQPEDHLIGHEKAQSDSNDEAARINLVDHEVEATDPPTHDIKPEKLVEQSSGEFNNDQVQIVVEAEKTVDDVVQEKSDQTQSESGISIVTMESDECERDGGKEAHDINLEPQVESEEKQSTVELTGEQVEMVVEIKPPAEEAKPDQKEALIFKSADSMENLTTAMDLCTMEAREVGRKDVDLEEAAMVGDVVGSCKEVLMEDIDGVVPLSATGSHVSSGGDRKVMEENEKLKAALEELMKAGNEQVSVIRELTGRVKDLEKKLSKKKRKVKKSSKRTRGSLVAEELKELC